MKPEKESPDMRSERSPVSEGAKRDPTVTLAPVIDFHSAEFNRTDDLNDNSGNYRFFESLDGIVTAHERHQMERGRRANTIDSPVDVVAPVKEDEAAEGGVPTGPEKQPSTSLELTKVPKMRCSPGNKKSSGRS